MMPSSLIRLATERDAVSIRDVYAPYVRETPISFEVEPPTVEAVQQRIADTLTQFPYLVCEHEGQVVGYVYGSAHRARAAYGWSVDVAVYIDPRRHRSGVGRALYASLFEILRLQGFYNAYAGVTLPNPASVGLHESLGFRPVGVYHNVGYKFGVWHDVGWWQLALREHEANPAPPIPLATAQDHAEWQSALDTGLAFLNLAGSR